MVDGCPCGCILKPREYTVVMNDKGLGDVELWGVHERSTRIVINGPQHFSCALTIYLSPFAMQANKIVWQQKGNPQFPPPTHHRPSPPWVAVAVKRFRRGGSPPFLLHAHTDLAAMETLLSWMEAGVPGPAGGPVQARGGDEDGGGEVSSRGGTCVTPRQRGPRPTCPRARGGSWVTHRCSAPS